MKIITQIGMRKTWLITRYANDDAFENDRPSEVIDGTGILLPAVSIINGNLLLNEGKQALHNLLTGAAETPFNTANSYLGVGDDATPAAATQNSLQAITNKLYKLVEAGYPTFTTDTTTWRSIFGSAEANFGWQEFTVASGNSDAADNLNRLVSNQGTKAVGQTWTLDLQVQWV